MDIHHFTNGMSPEIPSTVQTAFCDKIMTAEISQDFILPDYQPEMRKLLRVTPDVRPPTRFLGAGEAEFAGNVSFTVLYLGGDGALYTAETDATYTFRIPLEGGDRFAEDRPICARAIVEAEPAAARLLAPRKMSIRCRLQAHLLALCDEETAMRMECDSGEHNTEQLEMSEHCARLLFATGEAIELTDEVNVPTGEGELRLIETTGKVQLTEVTPTEGGILCRGELYWKALVTRDPVATAFAEDGRTESEAEPPPAHSAPIEILTRRIPFTQTVEMLLPSDPKSWQAMAHGSCIGIVARVEEDRILCAATVILEAEAMGQEKITLVRDAFSTTHQSECERRTYRFARPIVCLHSNVTESGTANTDELGIPQGAVPLDLHGTAEEMTLTCGHGGPALVGTARYHLLYRTAEGEFGTVEFRLPLRYALSGEEGCAEGADTMLTVRATLLSDRIRIEGASLSLDAEWGIDARLCVRGAIEAVDLLRMGAPHAERGDALLLCYPEAGASLWQIAKRYHTAIRPLAALNALPGAADAASPQSLEGTKFLMIS